MRGEVTGASVRIGRRGRKRETDPCGVVRTFYMLSHMKRTTLVLDAALYAELRRRAAAEGRTLTEVVERTLRLGLQAVPARRGRLALPSYDLGPFLVDPADRGEHAALRGGESAP
jgi:hypothetical protein